MLLILGRWTRISQGHLPLGAGCSCGIPAVSVRVADLERDLLAYLAVKHAPARAASSIAELLKRAAAAPTADTPRLLDDLERSLASFEELHGAR